MIAARRDFAHPRQARRQFTLISSPSDHGAVGLQGDGKIIARLDGNDAAQTGWHIGLPVDISTPSQHRAIFFQSERVVVAGRDSDQGVERGGKELLPVAEPAEAHHRAIGFKGNGVFGARINRDDFCETGGNVVDAVVVAIAPGDHSAVGFHRDRVTGAC